jgi:hypothetical protein
MGQVCTCLHTCLERITGICSVDTQVNLRRILLATKLSNDLPGEKRADYDYYSTFAGFRAVMQSQVRSSAKKLVCYPSSFIADPDPSSAFSKMQIGIQVRPR